MVSGLHSEFLGVPHRPTVAQRFMVCTQISSNLPQPKSSQVNPRSSQVNDAERVCFTCRGAAPHILCPLDTPWAQNRVLRPAAPRAVTQHDTDRRHTARCGLGSDVLTEISSEPVSQRYLAEMEPSGCVSGAGTYEREMSEHFETRGTEGCPKN